MAANRSNHANGEETALAAKQIFTTGEAAGLCKISQQTIIRCFDRGRLNGFRVPGSRFRRIPREELIRFMRENDIPTDTLEPSQKRVLVVDDDDMIIDLFREVFAADNRFDLKTATTGYDAGVMTEQFHPQLLILDYMLPDINGNVVCRTVRRNSLLAHTKIIVVSGVVNQDEIEAMLDAGADVFVKKPFNIEKLMGRVTQMLAM